MTMLCVVAGALAWGNFSASGGWAGGFGNSGTWTEMSLYQYGCHLSRGNSLPVCLMIPTVYGMLCALIAAMSYLVPLPRFQFRTLFLGTAAIGTILGWLAWERHTLIEKWYHEQPAIAAIQAAGGRSYNSLSDSHFPDWFVDPKYLLRITRVDLRSIDNADTVVRELKPLSTLERLYLKDSDITDAGLGHIAELDSLTGLELEGAHVTNKGVVKL
ncbi:MAG: hypothetical protein ACYC3X_23510 [Pirellulaceae bacterium]